MTKLPFNEDILIWIVDHRTDWLTSIFLFFTFLGTEYTYIMLVLGCYWFYNKKLAIKLTLVTLLSAYLNHILKISIRNKRPFIEEQTYETNWAVSESEADVLKDEFSTPSGHAMGSASFGSYLSYRIRSKYTMIMIPIIVFMVGISRLYLGVHYLEDVILGWVLGLFITYLVIKNESRFIVIWNKNSLQTKIIIVVALTIISWVSAGILFGFGVDGELFATFGGMLTGIFIGSELEEKHINFKAGIHNRPKVIISYVLGLIISLGSLIGLDVLFALITGDENPLGYLLRYVRYSSIGLVATFFCPWLFIKLGLFRSEIDQNQ